MKEHTDLWSGPFKGTHITGQIRRIHMLGTNYMIVDFDVTVSGVRQVPAGGPVNSAGVLRNHLKHILERRHGAWKVLSAQNTFISSD